MHTVKPLKSFISSAGNVVLLGDAVSILPFSACVYPRLTACDLQAHAMMPFQGSGAGQAIEDAYILGTLLTHPHAFSPSSSSSSSPTHTLQRIAKVYDAVRRPMAQHVASVSRDAGMLYTLNYPGLTFDSPSSHSTPTSNGVNGINGGGGRGGVGAEEGERLQEVYARIRMNWEWAWDTSAEGDLERAVGLFESGVEG